MKKYIALLLLSVAYLSKYCPAVLAQAPQMDSAGIDLLPSIPFLPDPLVLDEGRKNIPVKSSAQWQEKRAEIREQYQQWVSGTVPPAPENIQVKVLSEKTENQVKIRTVELYFGPGNKAKMTVELMIPVSNKPLPVFMTQWNHRGWAQIAVRRGYIGCIYAGGDVKDDTKNYAEVYPGYDFATLMKRAWGASRVVDYLYKLPEVDTARIALTGHSRNGKQSLMAAAFDERIKAVVSSSGGTGGECTFRFSDERFDSESVEEITRNFPYWFSPRLRLFSGREQKLPVDQNGLMSLIAPRGLMIVSAITEGQGNPWGIEQSYKSVGKAYQFLHAENNIAVHFRQGRHQHSARDVENFIDFFDYIFHRGATPPENKLYNNYSFEQWKQRSKEQIDPLKFPVAGSKSAVPFSAKSFPAQQDTIRKRLRWLLGNEPPGVLTDNPLSRSLFKNAVYPDDYLAEVIGEPSFASGVRKMEIGPYSALGEDLWGTIYFPASAVTHDSVLGKLPLVIFLHEYAYATGAHRRSEAVIRQFTAQGYAVLSFDMPGFGTRVEEAANFYQRYPDWSVMGKMVADTRGIINDASVRMPFIDASNIYLAGYSLGGTVALLTAALDERVKGVAVVAAFSSLRHDNIGTEGIRHFSHLHGLIPRLGFFVGHENNIPVDFEDILGCVAPRPLLIIAPEKDRHHTKASVEKTVAAVSVIYKGMKAADKLTFRHPDTYNHFPDSLKQEVAAWLLQERSHQQP
ncbi:alpha/beta fold hydrolase [Chitinophaga sp. MM2321]|uniref:alpha/beta fold hydrolase n=1 Tax=Chitinophaga sp. MM2321 TaxID=3137178 RepID=UPI0032D57E93